MKWGKPFRLFVKYFIWEWVVLGIHKKPRIRKDLIKLFSAVTHKHPFKEIDTEILFPRQINSKNFDHN